jgi:hypothetical protein
LGCYKPHRTSWETTSQFWSHSMVCDSFIWNYWSLFLWRWVRKGCKCDWTTLRSHVGQLRSWARSSSSNRRNVFPTRRSYEPHRTRFHGSCEEFVS